MKILMLGSVGDDVKQLQIDLNQYYTNPEFQAILKKILRQEKLIRTDADLKPLVPDSKFGPLTRAFVLSFQTWRKLKKLDGKYGDETATALHPFGLVEVTGQVKRVPASSPAPPPSKTIVVPVQPANIVQPHKFHEVGRCLLSPGAALVLNQAAGPLPKPGSYVLQLKLGDTLNLPIGKSVTDTLNLDFLVMYPIHWGGFAFGLDLGLGLPYSDGANFTSALTAVASWAPHWARFGDRVGLGLTAKLGAQMALQAPTGPVVPQLFTPYGSAQLSMTVDLEKPAQIGAPSPSQLYFSFGDSFLTDTKGNVDFTLKSLSAFAGVRINFDP